MSLLEFTVFSSANIKECSNLELHLILLALFIVPYLIYEKILKPPPSLRHIPHLNFFTLFKALVMRKSIDQLIKDISSSDVVQSSSNGIYLRRDTIGWTVRITRPEDVKLLMSRKDIFPKSAKAIATRRGTLAGRALFSRNVLTSAGDDYKRQRKIINPAFHRAMPMELFVTVSQKAIDSIIADVPISAHGLIHGWSMEIMMANIFGHKLDITNHEANEWITLFERITNVGQNTFYFAFPFMERNFFKYLIPELRKAHQDMSVYEDMINSIVRQKREAIMHNTNDNADTKKKDLLTLMIEASMQGEEYFSKEDFQANVFALFLAGHDTTSSSLSFTLYYLALHQNFQERAREEAICAFGDGYDIHPTFQETQNLSYITMVIKEALRLSPPLSTLPDRVATEDTQIAGTFIPKGTHVGLTVYELHRNPRIWKDPDTFDPERFTPGGEVDQLSGLAWTPFGNGGARVCTGMKTSLTQQKVFLPMLLRKYKWRLPEDSIHKNGVITDGYGAVRPRDLKLIFEKIY